MSRRGTGRHCAPDQPALRLTDVEPGRLEPERVGLYASWVKQLANDHNTALLMGYAGFVKGQPACRMTRAS
jgi:hypothetical protein